ncbi:MAG: hypothetical protein IPM24_08675 [Bryobacterales bacterium]|nr:hypothetical protein [Bryobacterales bacterium]
MKTLLAAALLLGAADWKERAPLPEPRAGSMAGTPGGRYVLAGGSFWKDDVKHWTARVDIFDPARNVWEPGPALPEPRSDAACATLGDTLYIFGGGADGDVTADAYALRGGGWQALPAARLPEARLYPVATVLDGAVYVTGGIARAGDYSTVTNTLWRWTPGGAWETLPALPGPRRTSHAATAFGGKLFVFGGVTSRGGNLENLADAWVYDPAARAWSALPQLPVVRRAWAAAAAGDTILLLGGYTDDFATDVWAFDPRTGATRRAGSLPHPLADIRVSAIGSALYLAGGETAPKIRGHWTLEGRFNPIR